MTELSAARETLYEAFKDAWVAQSAPYFFDNEVATPDAAGWLRLVVRHRSGEQETLGPIGSRKFERVGSVIVQVFTPLDEGTSVSDTLVDLVREVFEGKTLSGIRFAGVTTREIGPTVDKWYQVNVDAPFNYDETK